MVHDEGLTMFAIQDALAGMWAMVLHQGIGAVLVIGFLAAAYFSPVLKKDFFYAALIVGAFMLAEDIGIGDEKKHVVAQEKVVNNKVDTSVAKAKSPAVLKQRDPWNRKEY
jgi:hypothetical protein